MHFLIRNRLFERYGLYFVSHPPIFSMPTRYFLSSYSLGDLSNTPQKPAAGASIHSRIHYANGPDPCLCRTASPHSQELLEKKSFFKERAVCDMKAEHLGNKRGQNELKSSNDSGSLVPATRRTTMASFPSTKLPAGLKLLDYPLALNGS